MSLAVIAVGVWRALGAFRQWPLPPRWLKVLMVLGAFMAVYVYYGRINGQHAGAALLVVMLALKLTEMRSRRDVLIVVSLCYFTMVTHFLFSQELWTLPYLFGCAVAVTAMLIESNHVGGALAPRLTLRMGAVFVLQAMPVAVALFVLFPRVPGPLWGLPADAGAARSGISDTMSPGDISRLIESEEIAFRVRFEGAAPAARTLYWRGPVLWYFDDGRRWRAPFRGDDYFHIANPNSTLNAYQPAQAEVLGEPVRYEVTLEPHRQNWMFALDLPAASALPQNAELSGYYQLLSRELVKERLVYTAVSHTQYRLEPEMAEQWQRSGTRLPDDRNPRTLAMAQRWRAEGLDDAQVVERALRMFREQEFFYTLEPPELGQDTVDEFLFDIRRGFCEHYASSFTVLMRAAGIPARVVVGYQGAELNAVGDYYVVRQSDAHAWSEVWLPGRGWLRIDPTAAVAPSRIEAGISAALALEELPGFLRRDSSGFWYWRLRADVAWDWVNVMYDRWFIGFNPDSQFEFLSRFGLDDWSKMVMALTVAIVVLTSLVGLAVMRQMRSPVPSDQALKLWRRATRVLAGKGLTQAPYEGPRDYVERVIRDRPDLAPTLRRLLRAYLAARYLDQQPREAELELAATLKALKA
jgi:transglutaminase-like putative cysteine protease